MLKIQKEYQENKKVQVKITDDFTFFIQGENNFEEFRKTLIGIGMGITLCKEFLEEGKDIKTIIEQIDNANNRIKKAISEEE